MTHTVDERKRAVVVALDGAVEGGAAAAGLYEDVRSLCARGRTRFVVDLKGATRIDAQGLGALTGLLALARNAGGDLMLARVPGPVRSLLHIAGLRGPFATADDLEAALASIAGAAPAPPGDAPPGDAPLDDGA
jgi:anti-anti-sigma factor